MMLYSDYGPDFVRHCERECEALHNIAMLENAQWIGSLLKVSKLKDLYRKPPRFEGIALARGERYHLKRRFTQFLISDIEHLPTLIEKIKSVAMKILKTKREIAPLR